MHEPRVIFITNAMVMVMDSYSHVLRYLAERGIQVQAFAPGPIPRERGVALPESVVVEELAFHRDKRDLSSFVRSVFHAWRLGRHNADAVFALVTTHIQIPYGIPIRLLKRRCIFVLPGLGTLLSSRRLLYRLARVVGKPLYRYLLSGAENRVVVQNRDDRVYVIERLGVDPRRVYLMRGCGGNWDRAGQIPFFSDLPRNPRPIILVPARIIIEKGIREAVLASQILLERGVDHEMWFSSDIDRGNPLRFKASYLERIRREGKAVHFLGHQPSVAPLFEACDIVCLPSYREGLPSALVEAAACGRPIVTTDTPGCRDVVFHERTGLLVQVCSSESLADALTRLIQNPELAETLRVNAFRHYLANFTKERSLGDILPAFRDLGIAQI